ncbi:hypothetical protein [Flavobacterium phycosphaerae]|uniref:hypothetical protein n=1 Tax=Flavobacterium phycosphaerae TaxID=2697515 RepID=UPI00138AB754|nr:hypothetical protein [Flavobacterium phycosphaerae]
MAILKTEGDFPKRIGNYVLYPWGDRVVVKAVSGFATETLKNAAHYEPSRQTAKEFGNVSSLCKAIRVALYGILPKQNNLAVVNAFTKKMREVITCDTTAVRGERHLTTALTTLEGKQQLKGYNFNPEAKMILACQISKDSLTFKTNDLLFPETANYIGFRVHRLAFDFTTDALELVSTNCILESKTSLPKRMNLPLPIKANTIGTVFTLLEVQFYINARGTYIPMLEDASKSVVIVDLV